MSSRARGRWAAVLIAGATLAAGPGCGGGDGDTAERVTPRMAQASMAQAFPASVMPWPSVVRSVSPVLDSSLRVRRSLAGGAIASRASEGFWLATDGGRWTVAPTEASGGAARRGARDQLALFANAGDGIDVAVRPTPAGVATFTQFRAGASRSVRWKLSLPGGEKVRRLPKGGAGVFAPSVQLEPRATSRTSPPHNPAASRRGLEPASRALGGAYAPLTGNANRLAATASAPLALDAHHRRVRSSLAVSGDELMLTVGGRAPVVARVDWAPAGALGDGWFAFGAPTALRRSRYAIEGKRVPGVGCASEERSELGSGEVEVTRQLAEREGGCASLVEHGTP